ncbi:hypothetical protein CEXT_481761 [Caerostris extrusa]|uniref:Uncharacterized protein n=1 Tax=Caerostris extrusa TaxID=172846 RepID=A0AAV4X716_CAEEX|nr:hypothetical protein CEXT_481761 [Caerostris extrusa]
MPVRIHFLSIDFSALFQAYCLHNVLCIDHGPTWTVVPESVEALSVASVDQHRDGRSALPPEVPFYREKEGARSQECLAEDDKGRHQGGQCAPDAEWGTSRPILSEAYTAEEAVNRSESEDFKSSSSCSLDLSGWPKDSISSCPSSSTLSCPANGIW